VSHAQKPMVVVVVVLVVILVVFSGCRQLEDCERSHVDRYVNIFYIQFYCVVSHLYNVNMRMPLSLCSL